MAEATPLIDDRPGGVRETLSKLVTLRRNASYPPPGEESATGEKWIDGKEVFRRVIDIGQLPDTSSKLVPHGITGLDQFVEIRSLMFDGVTWLEPWGVGSIAIGANATNVVAQTSNDLSGSTAVAILSYTKV